MNRIALSACLIAAALLGHIAPAAPAPLLDFSFDEGRGNHTHSRGSIAAQGDLSQTIPVSWVPGPVGGHALKFTRPVGFGWGDDAANVRIRSTSPALLDALYLKSEGGLKSFTIAGWMLLDEHRSGSRIFAINDGISLLYDLHQLKLDGTGAGVPLVSNARDAYSVAGRWMFFAVTYNSLGGEVRFYVGYRGEQQLRAAGTVKTKLETLQPPVAQTSQIGIGNIASGRSNRPLFGVIDSLRFYGASNGSGALSEEELGALFRNGQ